MKSSLIFREENSISFKNFQTEVRGLLDVKHLICDAVVHTNVEESNLQDIIRNLLFEFRDLKPKEFNDIARFEDELFTDKNEQRLRRVIQGYEKDNFHDVVPTWMTTFCSMDGLKHRHVGIAFLREPTNFGLCFEEVSVIVLVLSPKAEKQTKSAYETCRTFATILKDDKLRLDCSRMHDAVKIKEHFLEKAKTLCSEEYGLLLDELTDNQSKAKCIYFPGKGVIQDIRRRVGVYKSDFTDGYKDALSISKTISAAVFLLFTILPTSIAYGMLNDENTDGLINVQKVILGQWIGGLVFGLFGGQALLIITTTAPLSIYVSVIYQIANEKNYDFYTFYCYVGIYSQILLIGYAIFQVSDLISRAKRSTEETFALFISGALTFKAFRAIITTHVASYHECTQNVTSVINANSCDPSQSLLFILLVFGTLWLSLTFSSFRHSVYLTQTIRGLVSDYSLPIGVIIMAIIGNVMFYNVNKSTFPYYPNTTDIHWAQLDNFSGNSHLMAFLLSVPLSLLFLVDQVLVTKTIDNKQNNLKKGSSYHWDLIIVAVINILLSFIGLPWMHGALPSAFLHLKAMSDVEHRFHNGFVQETIVHVRETRLAVLISHLLMIPIYIWLVPYMSTYLPVSLFHGLFLFMAVSSLTGNEFFERLKLLITDQRSYPPTHYIRYLPQRVIHLFTTFEIMQLIVLYVFGFYPLPYLQMAFPVVIVLFIPIRHFLLPAVIHNSHLESIDQIH
ncbi:unnamed protein product [Auanema sp. JU1783]|nr:unnamed protein product [Auanema sp. JU1783]